MKKIVYPITEENFSDVWKYANDKYAEFKKKRVIRLFLKVFANAAFLFALLLISYGILCMSLDEANGKFLDSVPILKDAWKVVEPMLNQPNAGLGAQIGTSVALLYGIPVVGSVVITLLIWFIYKPKVKEQSGDQSADAKTLWDMTKELNMRNDHQKGILSFVGIIVYLLAVFYMLFLFITQVIKELELVIFESMTDILFALIEQNLNETALFFIKLITEGSIIVLLVFCGLYTLISLIMALLLRPCYRTKMDTTLKAECEKYYYTYNAEAKAMKDQEDALLQDYFQMDKQNLSEEEKDYLAEVEKRVNEIREKNHLERKEISKKVSYRNPILVALNIVVYIIPFVFAINYVNDFKDMDTKEVYDRFGIVYITAETSLEDIPQLESIPPEMLFIITEFEKLPQEAKDVVLSGDVDKIKADPEVKAFLEETGLYWMISSGEQGEGTLEGDSIP